MQGTEPTTTPRHHRQSLKSSLIVFIIAKFIGHNACSYGFSFLINIPLCCCVLFQMIQFSVNCNKSIFVSDRSRKNAVQICMLHSSEVRPSGRPSKPQGRLLFHTVGPTTFTENLRVFV